MTPRAELTAAITGRMIRWVMTTGNSAHAYAVGAGWYLGVRQLTDGQWNWELHDEHHRSDAIAAGVQPSADEAVLAAEWAWVLAFTEQRRAA